MNGRIKNALVAAVLAAGTVFGAMTAHAQATFRVEFGVTPHWQTISGTRVQVIGDDERPDYDLFRVNGRYYAYSDGNWYVSDMPAGTYSYMEPRFVPTDIRRVPREYWYSYPTEWSSNDRSDVDHQYRDRDDRYDNDRDDRYDNDRDSDRDRYEAPATFRIDMRRHPHWTYVTGTSVEELSGPYRPSYDVFRYHHMYFVYADGQWYMGRHWDEPLAAIDESAVPAQLAQVPRSHWRSYPADWPNPDYRRHHHRH